MAIKRGLLRDFVLTFIFYGFDLGTHFGVLIEAQINYNGYKNLLDNSGYKENVGNKSFLHCSGGVWTKDDYTLEVESFGKTLIAVKFFVSLGSLLVAAVLVTYVHMIQQLMKYPDLLKEARDKNLTRQFFLGFACSMLQDIPMACLAVDLYADRSGPLGLICWQCSQDTTCNDKEVLEGRFSHTMTVLVLSLTATLLVSLYKGITTFYRWSKVDNVHCYEIRSCVSMFVGGYYALIIITPSLGLFKYKFFLLASERSSPFNGITDSLFMLGLCGWGIFVVIAFCCPLLHFFRD